MIPNTFFHDQPYTEAEEWFTGPWFREEVAKPLLDLKKSRGFALIERGWEKTAAERSLKARARCSMNWGIARSKDQRSFDVDTSSEPGRVGPSLFNLDPHGRLREKGTYLRNLATQASIQAQARRKQAGLRFRARRQAAAARDGRGGAPPPPSGGAEQGRGEALGSVLRNPLAMNTGTSRGTQRREPERRQEGDPTGESSSVPTATGELEKLRADDSQSDPAPSEATLAKERAEAELFAESPGEAGQARTPNFEDNFDEQETLGFAGSAIGTPILDRTIDPTLLERNDNNLSFDDSARPAEQDLEAAMEDSMQMNMFAPGEGRATST